MFEVTVIETFCAGHRIPEHPGKCRNWHGHNWKVEMTLNGCELDDLGMLVDFHAIKTMLREILDLLDHSMLNDIMGDRPTAELLAVWIADRTGLTGALAMENDGDELETRLSRVRVWESDTTYVDYYV